MGSTATVQRPEERKGVRGGTPERFPQRFKSGPEQRQLARMAGQASGRARRLRGDIRALAEGGFERALTVLEKELARLARKRQRLIASEGPDAELPENQENRLWWLVGKLGDLTRGVLPTKWEHSGRIVHEVPREIAPDVLAALRSRLSALEGEGIITLAPEDVRELPAPASETAEDQAAAAE